MPALPSAPYPPTTGTPSAYPPQNTRSRLLPTLNPCADQDWTAQLNLLRCQKKHRKAKATPCISLPSCLCGADMPYVCDIPLWHSGPAQIICSSPCAGLELHSKTVLLLSLETSFHVFLNQWTTFAFPLPFKLLEKLLFVEKQINGLLKNNKDKIIAHGEVLLDDSYLGLRKNFPQASLLVACGFSSSLQSWSWVLTDKNLKENIVLPVLYFPELFCNSHTLDSLPTSVAGEGISSL